MTKIIRLTESDLQRIVERVISEKITAEEPVLGKKFSIPFLFKAGTADPIMANKKNFNSTIRPNLIKIVADILISSGTLDVIKKYYRNAEFSLPKFITINYGTSSTGSPTVNDQVAQERIKWLEKLVIDVFRKLMPEGGPNEEIIRQLITNNTNKKYTPTEVDANFVDRTQLKANQNEQFGEIIINSLEEKGMKPELVRNLTGLLTNPVPTKQVPKDKDWMDEIADFFNLYDQKYETKIDSDRITYWILDNIETYSDITDVNNLMTSMKNTTFQQYLNKYLNCQQIDDVYEHFQEILNYSQIDPNTVQLDGCRIIIGLKGRQRKFGN